MQCLFMENTTIPKINYYKESLKQYKKIKGNYKDKKPNLLLHVCCGACSCFPLIFLADLFNVTIFFSNSNIYPKNEYDKRLNALKEYVNEINKRLKSDIKLVEDTYDYNLFKVDLEPFKDEREGLNRCHICITKRFIRLFEYAKNNGYNIVTTVMSISRNKDVDFLNTLGKEMSKKYGIEYFVNDFKKSGGQDLGVKLSKFFNVYRQDYCGCEFSLKSTKDE